MRRGAVRVVSSALLLAIVASMPHHILSPHTCECSFEGYPSSALVFSEFYPGGLADDEYFVISNQGASYENLRGWSVSDGEGCLLIISDLWLAPNGSASVSSNSSSFERAYGVLPTLSLEKMSPSGPVMANGTFRLGDSGDSLEMYSPDGHLADFVCYGSSNKSSPGWIGEPIPNIKRGEVVKRIRENAILRDTDSACDWLHFREFRYGYTEWGPKSFGVPPDSITAFVSPDCSLEVVLETIDLARGRISLCTYEFSSIPVTEALLRAADRSVSVRVLVDGSPAGGMSSGEVECLSVLARDGVDVRVIRGNTSRDIVQHVGAVHAKYLIVDGSETVVMSENLVEQGVPVDGVFGNRGWGAKICCNSLARFVEGIFEDDCRATRSDVVSWTQDARYNISAELSDAPLALHGAGLLPPLETDEPARVTVYASPDCSPCDAYICDLIQGSGSILAEQFQADLLWQQRWAVSETTSPILSGIVSLVGAGGRARVLFDSSWFNLDRNGAALKMLSDKSTMFGLDGEFAFLDDRSPIASLHNKGAVLDDRCSLVSSNNWVWSSYARNRELALLIDSPQVARYLANAFEYDWIPDDSPPVADAGPDRQMICGQEIELTSEASHDDRLIASFRWDVDGDGWHDSSNSSVRFVGLVPGSFRVVLTVEDAWGNMATDDVVVTVLAPEEDMSGCARDIGRDYAWLIPLALGALVLFNRMRRRPKASERTRKLNHRPSC
jgi:hypothetical protein